MRIDGVELHLLLGNLASQRGRELHIKVLHGFPRAIHDEDSALPCLGQHVELWQEGRVVACNIVSARAVFNLVLASNGAWAKAQVRHGGSPGLLRRVVEVALRVELCALSDNSGCGLVGADRAVGAQAEEDGLRGALIDTIYGWAKWQARVCHIVDDSNGEMILGHLLLQVVKHGFDMPRCELLAAEAIVATDNGLEDTTIAQGGENVSLHWQGRGHILLCAVEHSNGLDALRHLCKEMLRGEGPEEANLQYAHLLALLAQVVHRLLRGFGCGAHDHHGSLCLGIAVVLEELVLPPC
mmetsp:Transcript_99909/g.250483  ORF Transcript_99909/g.250483 Transcript_99909/m.250483 type:complete len:297 (-) Transcript_99909:844-1734(-)